jgi:glycosyltransferase involved in cell wall biosynthesis
VKVAIVHDWLVTYAGSERVLEQMLSCYPEADLYAVCDFIPASERAFLQGHSVKTTGIQRLPFARRFYRAYLPWMPRAVERLDLSGYDLVISSCHAVSKGVRTHAGQLHICMCYTPPRYLWDMEDEYLRGAGLTRGFGRWLVRRMLDRLRAWDLRASKGVGAFVAISHFIAGRIQKCYGRDSIVICPPVDTEFYTPGTTRGDFYVTASRLVSYKRIDLIVQAFAAMPDKRLVVIGDGPDIARIRLLAGPNVQIMGFQRSEVLCDYLQRARAFVFAAEEDFGIAPVEAQACGTPVIAFEKGGISEIVRGLDQEDPTGVFFSRQSADSIVDAVHQFEDSGSLIAPAACRVNAERFGVMRFRDEFTQFVEDSWRTFREKTV